MNAKKVIRLSISIFFSVSFVLLIIKKINSEDFAQAFLGIRWDYVLVAGLSLFIGYVSRVERWRSMLIIENPMLKWKSCVGPFLASFAANNVLPFRVGDAMRAFVFNHQLGVHSGTTLASLFVERLLDLVMVLLFLGVTASLLGSDLSQLVSIGSFSMISLAVLIVFLLFFPALFEPLANAIGLLAFKIFPSVGLKIQTELQRGFEVLRILSKFSVMSRLLAWSFVVWIAEGGVFYFAAVSLPSLVSPLTSWLALPVGTLATLIPSTPGYIGTFDFSIMQVMTLLGNSSASSAAYALLVHACLWLPVTCLGGAYLFVRPFWQPYEKWRKL